MFLSTIFVCTTLFNTVKSFINRLRRSSLGIGVIPIMLLIALGTTVYSAFEEWSLLDALYATIITITTVGYGDLNPQTLTGRIFSIFFTLAAIGFASYAISTLAAVTIEHELERYKRNLQERRMNQIQALKNHINHFVGAASLDIVQQVSFRNGKPPLFSLNQMRKHCAGHCFGFTKICQQTKAYLA